MDPIAIGLSASVAAAVLIVLCVVAVMPKGEVAAAVVPLDNEPAADPQVDAAIENAAWCNFCHWQRQTMYRAVVTAKVMFDYVNADAVFAQIDDEATAFRIAAQDAEGGRWTPTAQAHATFDTLQWCAERCGYIAPVVVAGNPEDTLRGYAMGVDLASGPDFSATMSIAEGRAAEAEYARPRITGTERIARAMGMLDEALDELMVGQQECVKKIEANMAMMSLKHTDTRYALADLAGENQMMLVAIDAATETAAQVREIVHRPASAVLPEADKGKLAARDWFPNRTAYQAAHLN
jgi:hypothetical protein